MKDVKKLLEYIENYDETIKHNRKLFNIYEGELLPYVKQSLRQHLSAQVFDQLVTRISPINVLIKIIDKLSKIYQQDPSRIVLDGNETDVGILKFYERSFRVNSTMNVANESFNLYKNTLLQVYAHNKVPRLRSIPSDRFVVYSDDPVDPLHPTCVVLIYGCDESKSDKNSKYLGKNIIYHAYTDEEFFIFDSQGKIRTDLMAEVGMEDGVNVVGKMPFVYINRSKSLLIPKCDSDTLKMTLLIPILLSDLNLAAMYQAFSIIYGINLDDEDLVMSPNAFWRLKSDGTSEGAPQIGTIKPQTDIDAVLKLIQTQLAFWLQSRGIRPGALGSLSAETMASGISKMVDEMDTTEDRKKQVSYFDPAEDELWSLVQNYMHPYFVASGQIEPMPLFSPMCRIETNFAEQTPLLNRSQAIDDIVKEMAAGLLSKRQAVARLDPHLTSEEIDERLDQVEDERGFRDFLEINQASEGVVNESDQGN